MTALTPDTLIETERQLIDLHHVAGNPYQTRLADDPTHTFNLAADILAHGLLQVPLARPHPLLNETVQLAFGHSRLAAYALLVKQGYLEYAQIPVDVRDLTDRQMSDMAAAENAKRKNLSAIETATALQRRIQDFKLTQAEAGEPFGLSQSAVANLLRLLKLPQSIQDQVHAGELPERLARQLASLAQVAPKQVEQVAKAVAKAPAAERDDVLGDQLGHVLQNHGRDLRDAAFEPDWPAAPIKLETPQAGLAELPACVGCPHHYKRDLEAFCVNPPCFDLKQARFLQASLEAAAKKLGVPAANGEKTSALIGDHDWKTESKLPALAKAGKADPALGLRVTIAERESYRNKQTTGSGWIALVTTAPAAVKAWLEQAGKGNGAGKAVKLSPAPADPGKPETPAQKAKREAAEAKAREAERQAQDERRRERGAVLRVEADVVWLVKNYTEIAAAQLTISGPILAYAVENWLKGNQSKAGEFYGLSDWYRGLEEKAEQAGQGKEADELRRQMVVAAEVFEHALPWNGPRAGAFGEVVTGLVDLADGDKNNPGFGAKLPAGWNKPPIHQTEGNCWHCGVFASQRGRLTKGELEAGWTYNGATAKLENVRCPDCTGKPAPAKPTHKAQAVAAKAAAKKAQAKR